MPSPVLHDPPPPPNDPEFQGPRRPDFGGPGPEVTPYCQRLVANPFLGLACLFATLGAAIALSRPYREILALSIPLLFLGMTSSYFLLQYHCLDCGATGPSRRWRRHVCPRVAERWRSGHPFWSRLYPTLPTQYALWLLAAFVVTILASTLRRR